MAGPVIPQALVLEKGGVLVVLPQEATRGHRRPCSSPVLPLGPQGLEPVEGGPGAYTAPLHDSLLSAGQGCFGNLSPRPHWPPGSVSAALRPLCWHLRWALPLHVASSAVTLVPSGARFPRSLIESKAFLQLAAVVTVQGHTAVCYGTQTKPFLDSSGLNCL